MTDDELAAYMGIAGHSKAPAVIASLSPRKRETYEAMHKAECELTLWLEGLGPRPEGCMIDLDKRPRKRKTAA